MKFQNFPSNFLQNDLMARRYQSYCKQRACFIYYVVDYFQKILKVEREKINI